ncbi:hypothetical protein TTHERM_000993029 (macronuclear) [Tetrahymena thermophila SB210]|uniref:Uncharacterized protein n=1 Tax=Tetrahymena thermophila (strain SB210) TaxID=312017 RepID=W7XD39_TETTS|nr:hypothetical protein TTHERM_000993029 [Tetrahymena thermophila SB210]EWS71731.1 hypothetical protein TTHERM_000993029 [Tetrahymena thermophila SB210]|eukprot:XP_012655739.1 hypothetical protein TTHERM_000993029 [Tetrahymena thermophila SB210]
MTIQSMMPKYEHPKNSLNLRFQLYTLSYLADSTRNFNTFQRHLTSYDKLLFQQDQIQNNVLDRIFNKDHMQTNPYQLFNKMKVKISVQTLFGKVLRLQIHFFLVGQTPQIADLNTLSSKLVYQKYLLDHCQPYYFFRNLLYALSIQMDFHFDIYWFALFAIFQLI